jgi:hypothetical protein
MQPIAGVELDDKATHQTAKGQDGDRVKDQVFETARLPLLRIPVQYSYSTDQLAAQLRPYVPALAIPQPSKKQVVTPSAVKVDESGAPICPTCKKAMVVQTYLKGEHKGEKVYVCPNYRQCKTIIPIKE